MSMNENGMIADDDKIYEKLDKLHEEEKYDDIVKTISAIPRENWSNKLWFRLISAYNNLKRFDEAQEELREIFPRCESPVDLSRWYYMRGYIYDIDRHELMAIHCYEDGLEADPDNTVGLDLEKEIESCREYVEKDLKKLRELAEKITKDIKKRYTQMPYSAKYELSDEEFIMQLGFLPAIHKIPGHEHGLGFKEYFTKYKGEQKEQAKEWFKNFFDVTDRDSFIEFYKTSRNCNISHLAADVLAYLGGEPVFDISELNKYGRRMFEDVTLFVKVFSEFLPRAGVSAWDMSEKIGFARHAYAVDYLTNTDYCTCMMTLTDSAKELFSSAEEYMLSLAFGSGLYMFLMDDHSISGGLDFILQMTAFLLQGDLADTRWKK